MRLIGGAERSPSPRALQAVIDNTGDLTLPVDAAGGRLPLSATSFFATAFFLPEADPACGPGRYRLKSLTLPLALPAAGAAQPTALVVQLWSSESALSPAPALPIFTAVLPPPESSLSATPAFVALPLPASWVLDVTTSRRSFSLSVYADSPLTWIFPDDGTTDHAPAAGFGTAAGEWQTSDGGVSWVPAPAYGGILVTAVKLSCGPSPSPSRTVTATRSVTRSSSLSPSHSRSATPTRSQARMASPSGSGSQAVSASLSYPPTLSQAATQSASGTATTSGHESDSCSQGPSASSTRSPKPTASRSQSGTPSGSRSESLSSSQGQSPTPTASPLLSQLGSLPLTVSQSVSETSSLSRTQGASATASRSGSPSASASASQSQSQGLNRGETSSPSTSHSVESSPSATPLLASMSGSLIASGSPSSTRILGEPVESTVTPPADGPTAPSSSPTSSCCPGSMTVMPTISMAVTASQSLTASPTTSASVGAGGATASGGGNTAGIADTRTVVVTTAIVVSTVAVIATTALLVAAWRLRRRRKTPPPTPESPPADTQSHNPQTSSLQRGDGATALAADDWTVSHTVTPTATTSPHEVSRPHQSLSGQHAAAPIDNTARPGSSSTTAAVRRPPPPMPLPLLRAPPPHNRQRLQPLLQPGVQAHYMLTRGQYSGAAASAFANPAAIVVPSVAAPLHFRDPGAIQPPTQSLHFRASLPLSASRHFTSSLGRPVPMPRMPPLVHLRQPASEAHGGSTIEEGRATSRTTPAALPLQRYQPPPNALRATEYIVNAPKTSLAGEASMICAGSDAGDDVKCSLPGSVASAMSALISSPAGLVHHSLSEGATAASPSYSVATKRYEAVDSSRLTPRRGAWSEARAASPRSADAMPALLLASSGSGGIPERLPSRQLQRQLQQPHAYQLQTLGAELEPRSRVIPRRQMPRRVAAAGYLASLSFSSLQVLSPGEASPGDRASGLRRIASQPPRPVMSILTSGEAPGSPPAASPPPQIPTNSEEDTLLPSSTA